MNDNNPSSSEEIAGLPIQITGLAIIPAGSGVLAPEIEVKGDISLFGSTLSADVLITDQGLQLKNASLAVPDINLTVLGGLSVDAKDISVQYDQKDNEFVIQGALTLKDLIQGESMTADRA